uniref:S1 RNA binding domain-containing protein n=1 Tax=Candidatus Kentrum sp. FW TaxID=2126338 RepID=A0A450T796_9GAMM|nr:MAG: S1 RNA binding domain-containing protein [Candidatus Kentron sp. FW]
MTGEAEREKGMEMNLAALLTRYEKEHPQRALGGVRALTGFDYQLRVYLADFVQTLADSKEAAHLMEAFSDFAQDTAQGDTVFVQVKRTLTRATLSAAAVEFATIDHFLRSEGFPPEQLPRYRIIARFSELDTDPSWGEIKLPARYLEEQPLIDCWAGIIRDGRLDRPRIEPDPWWRLIAAVFHRMDQPFVFANAALEVALCRGELSAEAVRNEIAKLFTEHRRPLLTMAGTLGHALTDKDFQPAPPGKLQVGQRPTLHRLREGQFMPRPRHVAAVRAELERHLETHTRADSHDLLTLFWITGRSGSGKSALLLQVMAEMVKRGLRAIWLEDDSAGLLPLFASLRPDAGLPDDKLPELVFLDDMYAPRTQQDLDLRGLQRLMEAAPERPWPLVVTCGPPEFEKQLRDDAESSPEIHEWLLAPVDAAEAEELRDWFRERTGDIPKTGPAFRQARDNSPTGGLMLSLAVEALHGNPEEFAKRFAARLRAAKLDEALHLPLALNRLYVFAPASWLTEADRERLETVNAPGDFVLDAARHDDSWDRPWLRLTHPHIADALYRAIRDPYNPRAMANDLAEAIGLARQTDLPTLRQLLRLLASDHERLDGIDQEHLADRMAKEWSEEALETDPTILADIRVSLACWHARLPEIGLERRLQRPLLSEARQALRQVDRLWPTLWQRLFHAWPEEADLVADALAWVRAPESASEPAWSFIWEQVWRQPGMSDADMAALARLAENWLVNGHRRDWHHTWKWLFKDPPRSAVTLSHEELFQHGWRWLTEPGRRERGFRFRHESLPAWAYVWRDLLTDTRPPGWFQRGQCLQLGADWLVWREEHSEWAHVWEKLVAEDPATLPATMDRSRLLERGHDWLVGREEREEWTHVWRALIEEDTTTLPATMDRFRLLERGHDWLAGREEREEWAHVWQALIKEDAATLPATMDRSRLLERGYQWLAEREERKEWTHVWRALIKEDAATLPATMDRSRLLERGHDWLAEREEREEWTHVWEKLIGEDAATLPATIERSRLLERGYQWLAGREEREEWTHVWQALIEEDAATLPATINHSRLLERGYDWLAGREEREEWTHVWRALIEEDAATLPATMDRSQLLETGYRWLTKTGREERSDWTFVWQQLFQARDKLPDSQLHSVVVFGTDWLMRQANRDKGEWDKLFEELLDAGLVGDGLLAVGADWVREHPDEPQTPPLVAKVLRVIRDPETVDELANWLRDWVVGHPEDGRTRFVMGYLHEDLGHEAHGLDPLPGWSGLLAWLRSTDQSVDESTWRLLQQWRADGRRVRGRIVQRIPNGFLVQLSEVAATAFLPGSQVDPTRPRDWDAFLGWEGELEILGLDEAQRSKTRSGILVSRRAVLEREREAALVAALASLHEGDDLEGMVTNITDFGVFVRLENGITGLLHKDEISWGGCRDPHEHCQVGERLTVRILRIDREKGRVLFGLKQLSPDPWHDITSDNYAPGREITGRVANIVEYGLFVEIVPGVNGLLHRSEIPDAPDDPMERFTVGQGLTVRILDIDTEARRIGLSLRS